MGSNRRDLESRRAHNCWNSHVWNRSVIDLCLSLCLLVFQALSIYFWVAILPRRQLRTELSLNGEFRRVRCTTPRLSGEAELWYSYCGEVSVVRRKSDWSDDSWFQHVHTF